MRAPKKYTVTHLFRHQSAKSADDVRIAVSEFSDRVQQASLLLVFFKEV